ncbi:hypothetical protein WA026_002392 [Henosepilachna vigintioctopunctata]|uniref:Uncharacterized protein n=1 Tax=Henosepilachna vigintioctopunctata TaxID=420089 RepID=A0AAW1TTE3_9CUCU
METTKLPPPSESSQKPKLVKKPKKVTKSKKSKSSQQRQLSPPSKMDKMDDPERKLYNLYENFHNPDTKDAEAEIKIAEHNRIDVLRDMLIKIFGSENLNPLNKSETQTQGKNKTDS